MSRVSSVNLLESISNEADCNFSKFSAIIDSSLASFHRDVGENRASLEVIDEIFDFTCARRDVDLFVSLDFKEIKFTMRNESNFGQFCIIGKEKSGYAILGHSLPDMNELNANFGSLFDVMTAFEECLAILEEYFKEIGDLDAYFCVLDPVKPTAKDNFRRIAINNEVSAIVTLESWTTASGVPRVSFVGPKKVREYYEELLQSKLVDWKTKEGIAGNLIDIFGDGIRLDHNNLARNINVDMLQSDAECCICLSNEPQATPMCDNVKCQMRFHQTCLHQWLISADPTSLQWENATGKCPNCMTAITCPQPI